MAVKPADVSKKDHDDFVQKLQEFHDARGTPIGKIPSFGGQPLDLCSLYNTVTDFGGIAVVTDRKKWGQIFTTLGFPPCTNAEYALRQHYARYLEAFERIYFFGDDVDDANDNQIRTHSQMIKYRRQNNLPKGSYLGEPLLENFNRIVYSLQSGLENEVNFALNICSLLSNVSNSIFNLAKSPKILDLVLSHSGIWSTKNSCTKLLYDTWYNNSNKNFENFWLTSLDEPAALTFYKLYYLDKNRQSAVNELYDSSKFFAKRVLKLDEPESIRVNQVCTILYNFSFETVNSMYMALHEDAVRFLLLSSCSVFNDIRKTGLDALDNISENIKLKGVEDSLTQDFFQILHNFLNSKDKFRRVRAMTILSKLASFEENNNIITKVLTTENYKTLVQTLHLPDISLILSSLDALYYLSGLNEVTATNIAMVHGCVNVLVCLVTIRAESFGNRAIQGFRIVENKYSIFTPKNQVWLRAQEERRKEALHHPMTMPRIHGKHREYGGGRNEIPVSSAPHIVSNIPPYIPFYNANTQYQAPANSPIKVTDTLFELDPEIYASHWMSGYYEPHPTDRLSIQSIYEDFVYSCKECKRNNILSMEGFTEVLRAIVPPHLAQITREEDDRLFIIGIQRRKIPVQVHSKVPKDIYEQLTRNKQIFSLQRKKQQTYEQPVIQNENSNLSVSLTCNKINEAETCNNDKEVDIVLPSYLKDQRLDTYVDCQAMIDKLKLEIQSHFIEFHSHRQQIQAVQMQIQQLMSEKTTVDSIPTGIVKDVQNRVQNHHQQMAYHYEKLQELNKLSEKVDKKMQKCKDQNTSINSLPNPIHSALTAIRHQSPIASPSRPQFQAGCSFSVPSPVPYTTSDMTSFQHSVPIDISFLGVPSTPVRPLRGRGSRGGKLYTRSPKSKTKSSHCGKGFRSRSQGNRLNENPHSVVLLQQNLMVNGYESVSQMHGSALLFSSGAVTTPLVSTISTQLDINGPSSSMITPSIQCPSINQSHMHSPRSLNYVSSQLISSPNSVQTSNINASGLTDNNLIIPTSDSNRFLYSPTPQIQQQHRELRCSNTSLSEAPRPSLLSPSVILTTDSSSFTTDIQKTGKIPSQLSMCSETQAVANKVSSKQSTEESFSKFNGHCQSDKRESVSQLVNISVKRLLHNDDETVSEELLSKKSKYELKETFKNDTQISNHDLLTNGITHQKAIDVDHITKGSKLILARVEEKFINGFIIDHANLKSGPQDSIPVENGIVKDLEINGFEIEILKNLKRGALMNGKSCDVNEPSPQSAEKLPDDHQCRELAIDVKERTKNDSAKTKIEDSKSVMKSQSIENKNPNHLGTCDRLAHKNTEEKDIEIAFTINKVIHSIVDTVAKRQENNTDQLPSKVQELQLDLTQMSSCMFKEAKTTPLHSTSMIETNYEEKYSMLVNPPPMSQICYCQWQSCGVAPFKRPMDLLAHMIQTHAPLHGQISICGVVNCKSGRKPRGDMITHFQEKHCLLRKQDGNYTTIPLPDPRLLLSSLDTHEDESPVTRSVRYTAALILRNIARNSAEGRRMLSAYESKIAIVAISTSEAACAAADILLALNNEEEKIVDDEDKDDNESRTLYEDNDNDFEVSEIEDDLSIMDENSILSSRSV